MLKGDSINPHSNTTERALQMWPLSKVRTGWRYSQFWKFFERFRTLHTTEEQIVLSEQSRCYRLLFMKTFYNVVNSMICCAKEARASIVLNIE